MAKNTAVHTPVQRALSSIGWSDFFSLTPPSKAPLVARKGSVNTRDQVTELFVGAARGDRALAATRTLAAYGRCRSEPNHGYLRRRSDALFAWQIWLRLFAPRATTACQQQIRCQRRSRSQSRSRVVSQKRGWRTTRCWGGRTTTGGCSSWKLQPTARMNMWATTCRRIASASLKQEELLRSERWTRAPSASRMITSGSTASDACIIYHSLRWLRAPRC